jgi:hypothetical protein
MINAGMAMVKNRVPLDIVIYRRVMGGDAWTRGSVECRVGIAWHFMFHLVSPIKSDLLLTLPTSISLNFIPIIHQG